MIRITPTNFRRLLKGDVLLIIDKTSPIARLEKIVQMGQRNATIRDFLRDHTSTTVTLQEIIVLSKKFKPHKTPHIITEQVAIHQGGYLFYSRKTMLSNNSVCAYKLSKREIDKITAVYALTGRMSIYELCNIGWLRDRNLPIWARLLVVDLPF